MPGATVPTKSGNKSHELSNNGSCFQKLVNPLSNIQNAREQFVHHALLTFLDLHGMSFWNTSTQLVDLLLELLRIHVQVMSDEDGMYGLLRSPHLQQTPSQSMNIHMPVSFSGQDLK